MTTYPGKVFNFNVLTPKNEKEIKEYVDLKTTEMWELIPLTSTQGGQIDGEFFKYKKLSLRGWCKLPNGNKVIFNIPSNIVHWLDSTNAYSVFNVTIENYAAPYFGVLVKHALTFNLITGGNLSEVLNITELNIYGVLK